MTALATPYKVWAKPTGTGTNQRWRPVGGRVQVWHKPWPWSMGEGEFRVTFLADPGNADHSFLQDALTDASVFRIAFYGTGTSLKVWGAFVLEHAFTDCDDVCGDTYLFSGESVAGHTGSLRTIIDAQSSLWLKENQKHEVRTVALVKPPVVTDTGILLPEVTSSLGRRKIQLD